MEIFKNGDEKKSIFNAFNFLDIREDTMIEWRGEAYQNQCSQMMKWLGFQNMGNMGMMNMGG
jgi:hypothetical protein